MRLLRLSRLAQPLRRRRHCLPISKHLRIEDLELTPEQRLFLSQYPPPSLFAVISWGCAATSWLAYILNSHPDIYCVHAANVYWNRLGGAPLLDSVAYLRLIGSQGHAHSLAGDVHGVSRTSVSELVRTFGDRFACAVVVRDPLPRLASQLALFERFQEHPGWDIRYVDRLISKLQLRLPDHQYKTKFFVHAANMLNAIIEEEQVGPVFRCEDLTSQPAALRRLVAILSRDSLSVDEAWVDRALRRPPLNVHRQHGHSARDLEDWQRAVLQRVVRQSAWKAYERLGYSVPNFEAPSSPTRVVC